MIIAQFGAQKRALQMVRHADIEAARRFAGIARQSRDAQSTLLTINQIIQSDRCLGARAEAVLEVLMAAVDPVQHPGTGALQ
jgi:hypothetical protein